MNIRFKRLLSTALLAGLASQAAIANDTTFAFPNSSGTRLSAEGIASAQSRLPMLTDPSQLPPGVRARLEAGEFTSQGFGTENHPFTTKRATTENGADKTIKKFPYAATGKLYMRFGISWFVCSASIIRDGTLVTAAHCVWDFGLGQAGAADEVYYEPARNLSGAPHGQWNALTWGVPSVYAGGTDVCLPQAPGVVCENDLAVVVLESKNGKKVRSKAKGKYGYKTNNFSYTTFLGEMATQLTELGYPVAMDGGLEMIRTDSLGYQDTPYNVIIGSDQTGGSSGGPWLANFGVDPVSTDSPPSQNANNVVMATTSWGFVADTFKIQGASRFGNNTTYTTITNIQSLVDQACNLLPADC